MTKVKRALISVFDKTGVLDFAKDLSALGVEIISTGGTAELLKKSGVPVQEISSVTKFPEMLNGRVKTLHPNIHGGLLAIRNNPEHMETLKKHGIGTIDLLVVNLYPFWDAVKTKTQEHEIIEMIDIGGPSMLRSASKNYRSVAAISDPGDYPRVIKELKENKGVLKEPTLKQLAAKVFKLTSYYDGLIAQFFAKEASACAGESGQLPNELKIEFKKVSNLRYGENPHQRGALYEECGSKDAGGILQAKKLHGKELSFNNILDLDAALELVTSFKECACAIIKHNNPCGFAVGKNAADAYKKAYQCDPLSAFGGIIALNREIDEKTADAILKSGFMECVIAESFSKKALSLLESKKNLRLLSVPIRKAEKGLDYKKVRGGLLLQDLDDKESQASTLRCVTKKKPKKSSLDDLLFAFKVCHYVKSNAIVIAKNGMTVGMGMGQTSRVDSCRIAFFRAAKRAKAAVLASDGFFPKPDSIVLAKKHGISAIIQPGGSIQDEEIIKVSDRAGIAMVLTDIRHFKH